METSLLLYITLAVSAATLLVAVYLAVRLKSVHYLLQQPVVKKMSPQLRLKPVKLDEVLGNRGRDRGPGGRDGDRPRGEGRPERRDGDRRDGRRDGDRPRGEGRPERRDGDRRDGRDGRPERSDRPEGERRDGRRDGDRPRGEGRPERRDGRDGDRRDDRRPPREFNETRDPAPAVAPDYSNREAAAPSSLPPRRPLPSFDGPSDRADAPPAREPSASETFVGNSDDVQHGRRTQLKKKPRFDFDEEEPAAPTV